ncbi:MAG: putative ATPase, partial [Planctomycetota bacterium]
MSGLFDEPIDTAPVFEDPGEGAPLAERLRPRNLEEYVGQRHLVGPGKILAQGLAGNLRQSLILWGPAGTGKTTLARMLAHASGLPFVPFSAVTSGIKEIKLVMVDAARERKRSGKPVLLFVDEIHRFNKAQQDAFLPHVERGNVLLVGATTENPSFEVVAPLLSRARTVILKPLTIEDLVAILRRALDDEERGLAGRVRATDETLGELAKAADGDARRALTLLETAAHLAEEGAANGAATIDAAVLVEALQSKVLNYDKSGEQHYDLISALHKSIRNSNQDAALYWLTRMLESGEDRRYLLRRLIRMAVEDIGIADPQALVVCTAAANAWDRLGSPEGELALVQAAVYLAQAPKSNAIYTGYAAARQDVQNQTAEPVPLHLRNAPTSLMKKA